MSWIKPNFLWMMYRCGWATTVMSAQVRPAQTRFTRLIFMSEQLWNAVDDYFAPLLGEDDALRAAVQDSIAAGLPAISVAPNQGKLLHLLARMTGARRILEVGTLGGYSTIWLARALPHNGKIITLELDQHHADVARTNVDRAGVGDLVDIRVGPAVDTLSTLADEGPFDLAFIDADKQSNPAYFAAALAMSRPGSMIVVDNVVRDGTVIRADADEASQGVRRLAELVAAESRVDATVIQTVGSKGYDGLMLALVKS
jgi:predicted O-methyltransferase YrrM